MTTTARAIIAALFIAALLAAQPRLDFSHPGDEGITVAGQFYQFQAIPCIIAGGTRIPDDGSCWSGPPPHPLRPLAAAPR